MKKSNAYLIAAIALLGFTASAHAQPDPATIIMMCDTNGDNAVTPKEWSACGAPSSYPDDADTNHDGKITASELKAWQTSGSSSQQTPDDDQNGQ